MNWRSSNSSPGGQSPARMRACPHQPSSLSSLHAPCAVPTRSHVRVDFAQQPDWKRARPSLGRRRSSAAVMSWYTCPRTGVKPPAKRFFWTARPATGLAPPPSKYARADVDALGNSLERPRWYDEDVARARGELAGGTWSSRRRTWSWRRCGGASSGGLRLPRLP